MARANYQIDIIPDFSGVVETRSMDNKGRVSLPASMRNVIAERNKFYLRHINDYGGDFIYQRGGIYLGPDLLATVDPITEKEIEKKDLAQIVTRESERIDVDIGKLNSEIYVIPSEIDDKKFLFAYAFFDWILYGRNITNEGGERLNNFILNEEYFKLKMHSNSRLPLKDFCEYLGISSDNSVGFKGLVNKIVIGNPKYMQSKR